MLMRAVGFQPGCYATPKPPSGGFLIPVCNTWCCWWLDVMVSQWTVKNVNFSTLPGIRGSPMVASYMKLNLRQLQTHKC